MYDISSVKEITSKQSKQLKECMNCLTPTRPHNSHRKLLGSPFFQVSRTSSRSRMKQAVLAVI